jgi:hypothetical protein
MEADTAWCWGCRRTLNEIGQWSALDNSGKREVWQAISDRLHG